MSEHSSKDIVSQLSEVSRKLEAARDGAHDVLSRNLVLAVEGTLAAAQVGHSEASALAGELFQQGNGIRDSVTEALIAVAGAIQTIERSVHLYNRATKSSGRVTFRSAD